MFFFKSVPMCVCLNLCILFGVQLSVYFASVHIHVFWGVLSAYSKAWSHFTKEGEQQKHVKVTIKPETLV